MCLLNLTIIFNGAGFMHAFFILFFRKSLNAKLRNLYHILYIKEKVKAIFEKRNNVVTDKL